MKQGDLLKLLNLFPEDRISFNQEDLRSAIQNTFGIEKDISAIVQPTDEKEVRMLVDFANETSQPLYPISRGQNIGYGDKLPITEGNILVDLKRMDKITDFDNELGAIDIEPGVTQDMLATYLKNNESRFIMDTTGAGKEASIVGNILEGGFGHTPKGNYMEKIKEVRMVLGNGSHLTLNKNTIGPDLRYSVIQSNFGIVTRMRIELMKIPKSYTSFIIRVKPEEGLESLVDTLANLRMDGTITSQVHISNAVRSFISTQKCPKEYRKRILTSEDVKELTKNDLVKIPAWSAIGGLYGSKGTISEKKKELKKAIGHFGSVMFNDDRKISFIGRIAKSKAASFVGKSEYLQKAYNTLNYVHGLGIGIPSDEAFNNIQWRSDKYQDMGLIWYGPSIPAKADSARTLSDISQKLFTEYGFEMPLTMTLVKPDRIVGILSISFDKTNQPEQERAFNLYRALDTNLKANRIVPYRSSVLGQEHIIYPSDIGMLIKSIKQHCDPNNIISPGRYGIR